MPHAFVGLFLAALVVVGTAFAESGTAGTESVTKQCDKQWQAAKAAGTTNGQTWPPFLAQCRAQQKGGAAATTSTVLREAALVATSAVGTLAISGLKECRDTYVEAKKVAGTTNVAPWQQFLAQCLEPRRRCTENLDDADARIEACTKLIDDYPSMTVIDRADAFVQRGFARATGKNDYATAAGDFAGALGMVREYGSALAGNVLCFWKKEISLAQA
jgi:hypothetical protein